MVSKTLNEALKECLKDDHKVSLFEAKVIYQMVVADGKVSEDERLLLKEALQKNKFDEKAFTLLTELLLRTDQQKMSSDDVTRGSHKHC